MVLFDHYRYLKRPEKICDGDVIKRYTLKLYAAFIKYCLALFGSLYRSLSPV